MFGRKKDNSNTTDLTLRFPFQERPQMVFLDKKYPVLELSQKKLKISSPDYALLNTKIITAELEFKNLDSFTIIGKSENNTNKEMTIEFIGDSISSKCMRTQEVYLIRKGYRNFNREENSYGDIN